MFASKIKIVTCINFTKHVTIKRVAAFHLSHITALVDDARLTTPLTQLPSCEFYYLQKKFNYKKTLNMYTPVNSCISFHVVMFYKVLLFAMLPFGCIGCLGSKLPF